MKVIKNAYICVRDSNNIEYYLCKLTHELNDDETYKYIFTPNYEIIDLLPNDIFFGIPGINLDSKKKEYVRENIKPVFISERVPDENREGLSKILKQVNMDYIDPLEFLIRCHKKGIQYSGDKLYLVEYKEKETIKMVDLFGKCNVSGSIKKILDNLAKGNDIVSNTLTVDDKNRKEMIEMLLALYERSNEQKKEKQKEGIRRAKKENRYKGRKPIKVDYATFIMYERKVQKKEMTAKEAAKKIGISIDKYYRYRKEIA